MQAPRILFVADAGPEIGGGHVMRCLTLAEALRARGAETTFLTSPPVAAILDVFADAAVARVRTASLEAGELRRGGVPAKAFDALVIDHYRLDAEAHRALAQGRPTLIIDDLADRPLHGDLIVEPDPGIDARAYDGLVPAAARLLIGPDYALVRPAFAALRAESLARRRERGPVRRVLVSLGLTDVGGVAARVVDRILPRLGEASLDVVLGLGAQSRAALDSVAARDPRVRVHGAVDDLARMAAAADLCVGAGGSSVWERCTLGLSGVLVTVADNQAGVGQWLAGRGAVELADARAPDFDAAFDRAFTGLMRSPDRLARLSAECASLCDGMGAGRVAAAFLEIVAARRGHA
jgi:UDP-2,4-diacetamido-2,4,6-trideoxy-beta-L-altropyranose hydrolase